ncbi:unnamed protein product [Fraxinus pennsylvanica]|uniref:Lunapark zinc ribbon domain-containing protein n=1 Tax=Fraxinus pennsylvanica TaxID=56036 RepID=A0AAD2DTJ0_9LAMI|nr:unnamed protein product [Fraxinus pennsylvanica]
MPFLRNKFCGKRQLKLNRLSGRGLSFSALITLYFDFERSNSSTSSFDLEMAGETKNDAAESATTDTELKPTKKKKGVLSRIWNALFRLHGDDFEKRLQYITKEEASVLARIKRRSHSSRRMARNIIIFSVVFEVIAVGYAIMTTRSLDLDWKMRALRVLPIFLLPTLSSIIYSALGSFTRMCDRRDEKTLAKLRAERQAKIDELKERTNYYTTQQLIQRYDLDPAAKAAAATVLASKLGTDSGMKVYMADESKLNAPTGKSNEVEAARTSGLRNRKPSNTKSNSKNVHDPEEEMLNHEEFESPDISEHRQVIVEHHHQIGSSTHDGRWIARIAALLVGEDPTQSYALICGNCRMHNGLARKEDFPYITYYCPHCNALNKPKQPDQHVSGSSSPKMTSLMNVVDAKVTRSADDSTIDRISAGSSPVAAPLDNHESEKIATSGSVR